MMKREVELTAIPKAGEPLEPEIHPQNQELLESDVQARLDRQRAKLSNKAYKQVCKRYNKLHKKLNKAGYNRLILELESLKNEYLVIKSLPRDDRLPYQEKFHHTVEQGRLVQEQLAELQPLADEFENLSLKLKAHDDVLAWEREDKENYEAFVREARTWQSLLELAFRQIPSLHHKGINSEGKEFIRIPKISHVLMKDDRVLYAVQTSSQSPLQRFFGVRKSELPYGVSVVDLKSDETLKNLSAYTNRIVSVENGKRGTNFFYSISRLDSPDGIPREILYAKIMDYYPALDHAKTVWCAGAKEDRSLEWFNFEDFPHVLVAGATQGGKSNHINQMIATLVTMNTPDEVRMLLIDLKGGIEFTHWTGLQHQIREMVRREDDVLPALLWIRQLMERRLQVFESMKAKNLSSYNQKASQRLPRIIIFVDELATLIGLGDMTKDIQTQLRVLSSQGRAVGIHLVLSTQHSSVDVIPGWVKTNMSMRISAKMPSHQASMVILDSVSAVNLPNIAGRMVFSIGRDETVCQSPHIKDFEIEKAVKISQAYPAPDNSEFAGSLPSPKPAFGRDDVLAICLEELDGQLSANQVYDIVGNVSRAKVRSIVDEIKTEFEESGVIEYADEVYEINRVKKSYVLSKQPNSQTAGHMSTEKAENSRHSDRRLEELDLAGD